MGRGGVNEWNEEKRGEGMKKDKLRGCMRERDEIVCFLHFG